MVLREDLVIASPDRNPEDEAFLHDAAAKVMKGIRRSELLPFLRRLADEGLWGRGTPYQHLERAARSLLLFGCWTRPGHGTFLKSSKDDPAEVGSWLRWDGLYHALWGQRDRSTDQKWKGALEASRTTETCPGCEGSGLGVHARLLMLAGRSLHHWVCMGGSGEFVDAVLRLKSSTPRQAHIQQRLLMCLAPLAESGQRLSLIEVVEPELARAVGQRVVETFTDMPVVFC